jgi:hypothetical protein
VWAALALSALAPAAVIFTPAGLLVSPMAIADGAPFPSVWPVVGSLVAAGVLVAWAARAFRAKEL